jgi:hypothetical protein
MKAKNSPNLKLLLLLIPLFGVVAISGCTNTTTGPTFGTGVTVLNWEPSLSSVESGDSLQLRLRIQNQGQMTAENVRAFLTGIVPGDWQIASGSSTPIAALAALAPPDRFQNTAGETREVLVNAIAPELPKGTTQSFTPQVRVFYDYVTTGSKLVTLVNNQELQRLQDQGKTLSSKDTITSSGPLKVTINAGKFLKTETGVGGTSRVFPITIDIQNVGGGMMTTTNPTGGNPTVGNPDYTVSFLLGSSSNNIQFIPSSGMSGMSDPCGRNGGFVQLWKGQTASVTCNVQIVNPPLSTEDDNLIVTLGYTYYIDASTSVSVTGINERTTAIPGTV